MPKAKTASPRLSGAALARHVFCTPQVVTDYEARGIIERGKDGKFDQEKCRELIFAHLRNQAAGRAGNSGENLATARTELANVQREAIEWKNAVNRGDFVSAAAVVRLLQDDFAVQRTLLLSWAGKLPSQLEGLTTIEMEAVFEREVYEILETLANPDSYVSRSRSSQVDPEALDSDLQPAPEAKPRGVGGRRKKGGG